MSSLYEDYTTEELKALRKRILEKRADGKLSVTYNGQSMSWASPAAMLVVANEIQREIRRRFAVENGLKPLPATRGRMLRPLSRSAI
ncbi:hypothetical protein RA2_04070 [Roseovarius sp. A-2]|uniref:hypothetical protein n=1 Tax=Roseovarius sp. A-2 TaxID=1570360 RepID=UPI0009B58EF9|nr:hypothetical protein [Roseovarius sp. A-2]GAW36995.1 hypothetical protein RA2_04070 [Roseovarius sp. A-2]